MARLRTIKRKKDWLTKLLIVALALLGLLVAGAGAFALYIFLDTPKPSAPLAAQPDAQAPSPEEEVTLDKRVSVLLIGTDKRPGESFFNSDVLIVASVDPETRVVSLLSVPRDTRIKYNGSHIKINSLPMYSNIQALVNEVADLTGIPLDGYLLTNFAGFKEIIDILGGVDIYVEQDMYKLTGDKEDGVINLRQGEQHLDGSQALQYARFRDTASADIGRTARQQKMLKAVAAKAMRSDTITKIPQLLPQILQAVETDLSFADLMKLARVAAHFGDASIVNQTMPGWPIMLNNLSYWEVNRREARLMGQNVLLGITTDRTSDYSAMSDMDPEVRYLLEQEAIAAAQAREEAEALAEAEAEAGDGLEEENGTETGLETGLETETDPEDAIPEEALDEAEGAAQENAAETETAEVSGESAD
ncbi:MAG: LCP family protein [Gracilibacteraceae bacterium]|nr:LCP family protein [Gracilibacteraceae bacterium]